MNATARDLPDAEARPGPEVEVDSNMPMAETVFYPNHNPAQAQAEAGESDLAAAVDAAGHDRARGFSDMPNTTPAPQGQGRYSHASGSRPLDGYTIKRAIGRGGFGEVYYATSDSGKEVALKLILRNLDVERRGVVQCMNLKCPNLLTVYDLRSNDTGDAFVIMEYVAGPSLANVLARHPQGLPPAEARAWLRGLVEGVAYLHDHGIVHRDLKPANLFMEEGIVKIGDYGLAKLITPTQGSEHSESIGTCHYMAPEIASGKYTKAIDVYAIGIILYEMLTGHVPFEGETVGEVLMKHLTARPDLSPLAEPFRSIVEKALSKDPTKRQQRVHDLLPAEDAPRASGVRFIGDGKTAPSVSLPEPPPAAAPAPADDVLRIEHEEPVFYIGPDTRPPQPAPRQRARYNFGWRRGRQTPAPAPVPRPVARPVSQRPAPQPVAAPRAKPVKAPPQPPPPPPPLPSARVRFAELTSSMLWAAPAAAVLSVIAASMMDIPLDRRPDRVAFLFGSTLLTTWGALLPAKLFEGLRLDPMLRRGIHGLLGALVGLAIWCLGAWVGGGPLPTWDEPITGTALIDFAGTPSLPSPQGSALYYALAFVMAGWPALTARDRSKRLRILGAARVALVAGLLGLLWPSPQPWHLAALGMAGLVVQGVSSWNAQAAAYTRHVAKETRAGRRVA